MINIPKHIGIIIDGNRRWAKSRKLPTFYGHKKGYAKLKDVADWCFDYGIEVLTCYVFSNENWSRSKKEVSYLMKLLKQALTTEINELQKRDIRLKICGKINDMRLPKDLIKAIIDAQEKTKNNKRGVLNLALNYGGRKEIIEVIKKIVKSKIKPQLINEKIIEKYLWTAGLPDLDLIIRTSEKRLSGFLLWQSAYSELFFIDKCWPDFTKADLIKVLKEYDQRQRRYGQ